MKILSKLLVMMFICAVLLILPVSAVAGENVENGTLSLVYENDIFHSDKYYTNGVRASWLSEPDKISLLALRAAGYVPFFPAGSSVRTTYSFGQNMYTPTDIKIENPPKNDRPYAGWLYGSVGLIAETGKRLDQLELTVGVVGPASLAEQTQKTVHRMIDSPRPEGWDHQLKNEPGFVLTYQRSWRSYVSKSMLGVPYDITPHAGVALGNVFTYASTGFVIRYGMRLPQDYGPPRIQPNLPGSGFFVPQEKFGWYLFAGLEGRAVLRNIFLDGNTFADSRSVDKEPFVADFQYGLAVTKGNYRFSYTNVLRSKEFADQDSTSHDFGALSVSVQF
ncbi:Protein of unknown function DUF2219 [Denitrovibrio acetiphilus DSM 12809]|uniref:Lipid A deacylase LpxR family protein n=1 Tax=Denitrovibrio acetiphilus (strain DSM 12809 / NBRC 114555 / N2460) TaxID=522772 RepID=D4H8P3_DENA2|nr:lipid A deacylase LpxR family protein [Denitrovibrio acetiphilus]ADD68392.1 Protein of unknown function DUF2219 [Denitrovibrio acetiphilus DSM 12809]